MRLGLPEDIRWLIEAKVRLASEFQNSYNHARNGKKFLFKEEKSKEDRSMSQVRKMDL